jgi:hypothetical protein
MDGGERVAAGADGKDGRGGREQGRDEREHGDEPEQARSNARRPVRGSRREHETLLHSGHAQGCIEFPAS